MRKTNISIKYLFVKRNNNLIIYMNNTEIIVIIVILSLIFLISINSCAQINNILLYVNNNIVRFIMILFIIAVGKYNVNIGGLVGLLFLIMINKANHIEGLENIENNKYKYLNLWLGLMLINPMKYILLNQKYNMKQEIEDIKVSSECKQFSEKYLEIMDNDTVQSIALLLLATQSPTDNEDIPSIFKTLQYEDMIIDFEKVLNDNQIIEKDMNNHPFLPNVIKEKNGKIDKNKLLTKLLPFLKNNKECVMKLFNKVVNEKSTKESTENIMNEIQNEPKKITRQKLIEKSNEDGSVLKCDDELKEEDDCGNGSVCSKGFYCKIKEKGTGIKYLCSPFKNPVICNDGRFTCPSDSNCINRQRCRDIEGNLTEQVMSSDGYTKNNQESKKQESAKPRVSSQPESRKPRVLSQPVSRKPIVLSHQESVKPIVSSQSKKMDDITLNDIIDSKQLIDEKVEETDEMDSLDYTIPIAKKFPKLNNTFDKKNVHNPSYTVPILNCRIDKHDFHKNHNICPDCK